MKRELAGAATSCWLAESDRDPQHANGNESRAVLLPSPVCLSPFTVQWRTSARRDTWERRDAGPSKSPGEWSSVVGGADVLSCSNQCGVGRREFFLGRACHPSEGFRLWWRRRCAGERRWNNAVGLCTLAQGGGRVAGLCQHSTVGEDEKVRGCVQQQQERVNKNGEPAACGSECRTCRPSAWPEAAGCRGGAVMRWSSPV